MCKMKFTLNGIIGHSYGSSFIVTDGHLVPAHLNDVDELTANQETGGMESSSVRDNRELIDTRQNQLLSREEIHGLRLQGVTGEEIVEHLVEKSATFSQKTDFAQQKYIKKKKQKHVSVFKVLRPNSRTIHELYYGRGPTKICNLRLDSISQILTQCNVQSGSRLLVVESCNGLLLGAILERMAGVGTLIHLYTGSAPSRQALTDGFHFSDNFLSCLHSFPLDLVYTLQQHRTDDSNSDNLQKESLVLQTPADDQFHDTSVYHSKAVNAESENCDMLMETDDCDGAATTNRKRKHEDVEKEIRRAHRLKQINNAREIIEGADMDGLIVAAKLYPTPVVCRLLNYIKPSRPIVVFSPYKEPLVDCYIKLRESRRVIMLSLSETWLRSYQVLPDRTHPSINMSGSGGFLLTGIVVDS